VSEKYNENCMKFSNDELKNYLYDKFFEYDGLQIKCLSVDGDEVNIMSNTNVETIAFDENENISIMFFGCQTSIFVYNQEIMFIDEDFKGTYTSSDIYNNAVYEGALREMSHEQMLQMFSEIIMCFIDATEVSMTQSAVPRDKYKRYNYYEPNMFTINVQNDHVSQKVRIYENITIIY